MSRLKLTVEAPGSVVAGYDCPCGCQPAVAYTRGGASVTEGCCCGNEFVVGLKASHELRPRAGFVTEIETFRAPWGEELEAAWSIGPSTH